MTHAELVTFAAGWLRRTRRHPIVLSDVTVFVTHEQPDVIGWSNKGSSTLIECKASRSDFLRDARKWFRRDAHIGMGQYRWFCAPAGLIAADELPPRWGLIEPVGRRVRVVRTAESFYEWNERAELALLVNALRRATEGWGRRMFGEIAPPAADGDPHPTASKIIRDLRAENVRLRDRLRALEMEAELARTT